MRGARRATIILSLAALVAIAGSPAAGAQRKSLPDSNLQLLNRALTEAARTLVARSPIAPASRLALKHLSDATISPLATRSVLAALTERRVEIWVVSGTAGDTTVTFQSVPASDSLPKDLSIRELRARQQERRSTPAAVYDPGTGTMEDLPPDEADLPLLVVRVDEARVDYPRLFRSGLFGGLHVERRAIASLSAELRRPRTRAVYWVGAADTSLADHVLRSEVTLLEDASHSETRGTVPSQSWQKVIEPVLVVGLVAGLISLFYTNRP